MKLLREWLLLIAIERMLRLTLNIRTRLGKIEAMWLGLVGEEQAVLTGQLEKLKAYEKEQLKQVQMWLTSRGVTVKSRMIMLHKERMEALRNLPKHLKAILLTRILKALEKAESYLQKFLSL